MMLQGLNLFVCVVSCVCVRFVHVCGGSEVFGDVVWYVVGCVFCCFCLCF